MNEKRGLALHWKILIALLFGVIAGYLSGDVTIALITSIGVAAVPSASLVAIAIILTAIGLPLEAIGVLLVFDRILDMSRTATNVFGDACCTVIVSRPQGEELPLLDSVKKS